MSNVLNEIKLLLIQNEMTMTELNEKINKKYDRQDSLPNLHKKLSKETIRYTEILGIAEILGYKLAWVPKELNVVDGKNGIVYSSGVSVIKHKQKGKDFQKHYTLPDILIDQMEEELAQLTATNKKSHPSE